MNYNSVDESQYVNRALTGPLSGNGNFVHTVTQNVDYFDTARVRLGISPNNKVLFYVTGGYACGDVTSRSYVTFPTGSPNFPMFGSESGVQSGWTAGGGIEYALSKCWSVKAEYLYVDLGSKSYTYSDQFGTGYSYTTQFDTYMHVVRLGLNYKF